MAELAKILENIFRENGRIDLLQLSHIKKAIAEVFPKSILRYFEIEKFRNGKLYLKSNHSVWSAELNMNKNTIIEKLNAKIGDNLIKEIKIK